MKLRKLDKILEQCIEETTQKEMNMTLNLNKLSKICNEALEEDTLHNMAKQAIEDVVLDQPITDHFTSYTMEQIETALVNNTDYKVYGEHNENCLVLDVKGRPNITNKEVEELLEKHPGELNEMITQFAQGLHEEYPNFIVVGRMGGYWGLKDLDHKIEISERGKQILLDKLIELAKNNEADTYEGTLEEAEEEDRVEAFLQDLADNYYDNLMDELLQDDDAFQIAPAYLQEMKNLEADIDSQEKAWNDLENWQYLTEEE